MRIVSIPVAVLLAFLVTLPAYAQKKSASPPSFNITTDREVLVQGESFELQITIKTESTNDPIIKLPIFNGLRILSQSEHHPKSFSFSFGFGAGKQNHRESKQQSIYSFVIVADRPGKYTINPIKITVDGQTFKSTSYKLNVKANASATGTVPGRSPGQGQNQYGEPAQEQQPQAETINGAIIDPDHFIALKFSKDSCFVGEMVILTAYLYTTVNLNTAQIIREPGTEGFWVETLETGSSRGADREQVRIGNTEYLRITLRKLALFPIESGELEIAPAIAELETRGGGFFSRGRTVKRSSPSIKITVNPLPTKDQPLGFDPANVGMFSYRVTVDQSEAKVGEPITLVTTVRGRGNMRNLSLPVIKDLESFKVYDPESEVNVQAAGNDITGNRTSRTLMIPKKVGVFSFPDLSWTYFDPQQGKYITTHGGIKKIKVNPGEGFAGDTVAVQANNNTETTDDFKRLDQRLRTILSRADLTIENNGSVMSRPWFITLILLIPLGFIAVLLTSKTRRKLEQNRAKGKSKRAAYSAKVSLDLLTKDNGTLSSEQFFARLQKIIVSFLEDRFEATVVGDTMSELNIRLLERGISIEIATMVVSELEACDFARFAKSSGDKDERNDALNRIKKMISDLGSAVITAPPKEDNQ